MVPAPSGCSVPAPEAHLGQNHLTHPEQVSQLQREQPPHLHAFLTTLEGPLEIINV